MLPGSLGSSSSKWAIPCPSVLNSRGSSSHSEPSRLVLYSNARVWTGDPATPHADAFAVDPATGRFAYVGGAAGAPPAARAVDLGGQHVIPGLIDSHVHLINGGLSLSRLDLSAAASRRQFVDAVAAAVAGLQPGAWLLGGGWDESRWGGELPSAAWIDEGELLRWQAAAPVTRITLHKTA
jgi:predicted amidohydrolase YtcJ